MRQIELQQCPSSRDRVVTLLRITRLLASEALGALTTVPYGQSLSILKFATKCKLYAASSVTFLPWPCDRMAGPADA